MILEITRRFNISILKQKIKLFKTSRHPLKRAIYTSILYLWKTFHTIHKFLFRPDYRSFLWLKYKKNTDIHQIHNYTQHNRYPALFLASQKLMQNTPNLKILSFGCSTGEEVFTLNQYFPNADIVGVDINKKNIKKALQNNTTQKNTFSYEIESTLNENKPFDIIFVLAVLQRTENRDESIFDSSMIYPFEKFNTKIEELDYFLKKGGLFVIDQADYFFEDCKVSSKYEIIDGAYNFIRERYMFDKHNKKFPTYTLHHRIFKKSIK